MRQVKKRTQAAGLILALVLLLSPVVSVLQGSRQIQAAEFRITLLAKGNMLTDTEFEYFGEAIDSPILYWMKEDGTPLFCIQQHRAMISDMDGREWSSPYESSRYFTELQYELVSIVLQCCGMVKGEECALEPGEYIAGQASVWGILSGRYTGAGQLRSELERLHQYIGDWNGLSAEQMRAQAEAKSEEILQAIEDYYGDTSRYIPVFASKYEEKAPVWPMEWEGNACVVSFSLGEKAEAVKEFIYDLPEGWSCEWEGDQITFRARDPKMGTFSVTGTAGKDSELGDAFSFGLMYLVGSSRYPSLQTLASSVEQNTDWKCYFKLSVPEKPEDPGSWRLPEVKYYRHQEDFLSWYGTELIKIDGDTEAPLAGAEFQVLEAFDPEQLSGTNLDPGQFEQWSGWRACGQGQVTGESGKLRHWDQKEYHYEKTYCGGHPEPEISYEGRFEAIREKLEEEAWEAWEQEVEACSKTCDFHTEDGSGQARLEADRDEAYQQFIQLAYQYMWEETKCPAGYKELEDRRTEPITVVSVQAGSDPEKDLEATESQGMAAYSLHEAKQEGGLTATRSNALRRDQVQNRDAQGSFEIQLEPKETEWEEQEKELLPLATASSASSSNAVSRQEERLQGIRRGRKVRSLVWLTSLVAPLNQEFQEEPQLYPVIMKNYKKDPPKEPTPEETEPEETPPPEETKPEETLPPPPEETRPEETLPPPETKPVLPPSSGGGRGSSTPPRPAPIAAEEPPLAAAPRRGWIQAGYALPDRIDDDQVPKGTAGNLALPKTGDEGSGWAVRAIIISAGGILTLLWLRRRRGNGMGNKKRKNNLFGGILLTTLLLSFAGSVDGYGKEPDSQLIVYLPAEDGRELPDREYVDEQGQEYILDSCRQVEKLEPEIREMVREIVTYEGIERTDQIPERVVSSRQGEEGRRGSGELKQTGLSPIASHWQDDFSASVVFYDYGADQYALHDSMIPGEMELQYLLEHSQLILEELGCDEDQYEILELVWDGEAYMDQGIPCRKAQARGRKLVQDYQVFYEGEILYPQVSRMEWEAVYQKAPQPIVEIQETEPPQEEIILPEEVPGAPSAPPSKQTAQAKLWQTVRTLAAYTISLMVLLPVLVYLSITFWRRGRKKWKLSEKWEK